MNTRPILSDFILNERKVNYNTARWSNATIASPALANYRARGASAKGKVGAKIVASLESLGGHEVRHINDEGDLLVDGIKAEVKTSSITYFEVGRGDNKEESWSAWFNQIRPKQGGWEVLYLVTVGCERTQVYKMGREDFMNLLDSSREPLINTDGHMGTDDLAQVRIINTGKNKNSHRMLSFVVGSIINE